MTTTNVGAEVSAELLALRADGQALVTTLSEAVEQVRGHDHPQHGGDLYCLNLTSFMGDRMPSVLRMLAAERAEVDRLAQEANRVRREAAAMASAWRLRAINLRRTLESRTLDPEHAQSLEDEAALWERAAADLVEQAGIELPK
ncbi:hypothetical protein [Micromonospora sp. NPDC005652]|uniref:hypothetical protein n=1 Tax=Micromonospora sp. NPDC005652 TaxID=3157046 RepID=UPI0033D0DEC0